MIAEKEIKQIETPYDRILKVNPSTDLSTLAKRRIKTLINKWTIAEGMKKQKYVIEINKVIISENAVCKEGLLRGSIRDYSKLSAMSNQEKRYAKII